MRCAIRREGGGGGGEKVQRPVGALASSSVCVGPSKPGTIAKKNTPSELSRSLSRHNYGAAGGGHPVIEPPCILHQTPRTLFASVFYWWSGGLLRFARAGRKFLQHALKDVARPFDHPRAIVELLL